LAALFAPQSGWRVWPAVRNNQTSTVLYYAVIFLLVAILAGVLGFGVIAGTAATIAKVLIVIFLVLFIVSLLRGRSPKN